MSTWKDRHRGPRACHGRPRPYSGRAYPCDACGQKTTAPRLTHGRYCWDKDACAERAVPVRAERERRARERREAEAAHARRFGELFDAAPCEGFDAKRKWAWARQAEEDRAMEVAA